MWSNYYMKAQTPTSQGIPIPRRSKRHTPKDRPAFAPIVRPPLYPPATLAPPCVITPQSMSRATLWPYSPCTPCTTRVHTPWTQPLAIPEIHPHTPVWPPIEVVPPPLPFESCGPQTDFLEPGTFPAVPFGTPVPVRLHPHLIYNPANPWVPFLEWDISHRPEVAKRHTGRHVFVSPDLLEKATLPAMPNMWISSDHPVLAAWMMDWGPIVINKADCTVRDILDAIWEYMRVPLTERDVERVKAAGEKVNLERSARQRVRDGHELRPVALSNGFMRVDVLGGHRKFLGLRAVVNANRSWNVYIGLTSLPVTY